MTQMLTICAIRCRRVSDASVLSTQRCCAAVSRWPGASLPAPAGAAGAETGEVAVAGGDVRPQETLAAARDPSAKARIAVRFIGDGIAPEVTGARRLRESRRLRRGPRMCLAPIPG